MPEREHTLIEWIDSWLERSIPSEQWNRLNKRFTTLASGAEEWEVFHQFSALHRLLPKERVALTDQEKQNATRWIPGWQPERWDLDELGRVRLLLTFANLGKEPFLEILDNLFETADMRESEALYKSLAVLPWPERLAGRAAEGVRSNITTVYQAVAHHNPYPAAWLDDAAWNQMILKALFIETPLYPVWRLDERRNESLFQMAMDLAHERWAAGRSISPEVWRLASPWIGPGEMDDLQQLLTSRDPLEKQALRRLCMESDFEELQSIPSDHSDVFEALGEPISWDEIGQEDESREATAYS